MWKDVEIFCYVSRWRNTQEAAESVTAARTASGHRAGSSGLSTTPSRYMRWAMSIAYRKGRNTLLRVVRQLPAPSLPTPRVLGVDDFALRKRQTYGTILVDLERRQPVALLLRYLWTGDPVVHALVGAAKHSARGLQKTMT